MDENEYTLRIAEIIVKDWRAVMVANDDTRARVNLPGDETHIMIRAMEMATAIADDFYRV